VEVNRKTLIMGAGGRDFHNFFMYFKHDIYYDVVAFTWAQIEGANITSFPAEIAGSLYAETGGIPIFPEEDLEKVIEEYDIELVFFCYSDVSHQHVMHIASRVNAAGADFILKGPKDVMVETGIPTIAVTAVRTGCGKSGITRYIAKFLKARDQNPVIIRHPMAYRDLVKQRAERFATYEDLKDCTIEEREEFEPLINAGFVVWCGVDYQTIVREARRVDEPTHFIWDGGNNDFSFLKYDKLITVVDPFRWGDTDRYYPGEMNLLMADVIIVNKANTAKDSDIESIIDIIRSKNSKAEIIQSGSVLNNSMDVIKGLADNLETTEAPKILVIEDGPTTTHGGMLFGIGSLMIAWIFEEEPVVVPAVGYNNEQLKELEKKIRESKVDLVVSANNVDMSKLIKIDQPYLNWGYDNEFRDSKFDKILDTFVGA
jgi:predicted GTPase